MSKPFPGFFIAPLNIGGEIEGVAFWDCARLSVKWLEICSHYLHHHGATFEASWGGELSHIETRFTSASGAALATFKVRGRPVASLALVSGIASSVDDEVLKMFVDSLSKVETIRSAERSNPPFEAVFGVKNRPLMLVLPWPDQAVAEPEHSCVRELALHLAGAFFSKLSSSSPERRDTD